MRFEFKFPDVGEGVHEGKILKLNFKPGDEIEEGDILAVVETDKVVAEIPSSRNGVLEKYGAAEGQIIKVGETLAYIEAEGSKAETADDEETGSVVGEIQGPKAGTVLPASGEGLADKEPEALSLKKDNRITLATPLARKLAADLGLQLEGIRGSGPGGRVLKQDILDAASFQDEPEKSPPSAAEEKSLPAEQTIEPGAVKTIEFSQIRKTIAANMEKSHQIPAFVIHDEVIIDPLVQFRDTVNKDREKQDRLSFIPFFMKALSLALLRHPFMNAHYDAGAFQVRQFGSINIGFAVDTVEGLIVPVIKNAESKSIVKINHEIKNLAQKAAERTIALEETRGGTFTITNYGPFAGIHGRPLIMPPQVGIMGFGRIEKKAVVKNDAIIQAWVLPVSLVADHRAVDGAPAGRFLKEFKHLISRFEEMIRNLLEYCTELWFINHSEEKDFFYGNLKDRCCGYRRRPGRLYSGNQSRSAGLFGGTGRKRKNRRHLPELGMYSVKVAYYICENAS